RIVDADQAYVNGVPVGNITYQYPPRRYEVPAHLLHPGKNTVVVRITNFSGKGGMVPDKPYYIAARGDTIDLRGEWRYRVGQVFLPRHDGLQGGQPQQQNMPTGLYNTMVQPVIPFAIRGFVWYQGESNTGNAFAYRQFLPALINDWRRNWYHGKDLPFLFVQLPNFQDMQYLPSESNWALLRESQMKSLSVPNTAMVVTIDCGEWNDIHPLDKKDVGDRLALAARKLSYGETGLVASGPLFESADLEDNHIRLHFSNTGSGLIAKGPDDSLHYFAIAGADKHFVWAHAKIENNTVVVWSNIIPAPKYVRYAWADNPDGANLYNKEGLPASPFRTDQ
ncbi:MAG TPA: sialate O-acetylesterase, partial [Sediminibacterium sp.]|nr:sialate O-acetylesterase [Sediminibacterium sp.]